MVHGVYGKRLSVCGNTQESERQLAAESAECCRTRGSSHLPSREVPARTATGEPDMQLSELGLVVVIGIIKKIHLS